MNPFKCVKCLIFGHDTLKSKPICAVDCDHWLKKCNCCGLYILNGNVGSVTLSKKSALSIKEEFEGMFNTLEM